MQMEVLVNAVAANMGGAVRHLRGMTHYLVQADLDVQFTFLVDAEVRPSLPGGTDSVQFRTEPRRSHLRRLLWDQVQVPRIMRETGSDLLLSMLNFGPVRPPGPQVVFQRNPNYYCEYRKTRSGWEERLQLGVQRWLALRVMEASVAVVTPTDSMGKMIARTHPELPTGGFRTIFHGFDRDRFLADAKPLSPQIESQIENSSEGLRFLYASHPAPHKGFDILFRWAEELERQGLDGTIFLTVDRESDLIDASEYVGRMRRLGVDDRFEFLGRIPQDAMPSLYERMDIFLFPSLCESFGFPMVEAMSARLPTIAAGTPVNREILQDAARFYPPEDPQAAARVLSEVIDDPSSRKKMSDAGWRRSSEFGWDRNIEATLDVCREALEHG